MINKKLLVITAISFVLIITIAAWFVLTNYYGQKQRLFDISTPPQGQAQVLDQPKPEPQQSQSEQSASEQNPKNEDLKLSEIQEICQKLYNILFSNYRVSEQILESPAPLDLSSHPWGFTFKTQISSTYNENKKPNFAGHYIVASWGCGSNCQSGVIIDQKTGKIYDLPETASASRYYFGYSNLLIVNPGNTKKSCDIKKTAGCVPATFYLWENNNFREIKPIDINLKNLSGTYSYDLSDGSGTLRVIQLSANEIIFSLFVDRLNIANGQVHMGEIEQAKAKLSGNIALYENQNEYMDEKCKLEIKFNENSATIKSIEMDSLYAACDFGMNVAADGAYQKTSNNLPKELF